MSHCGPFQHYQFCDSMRWRELLESDWSLDTPMTPYWSAWNFGSSAVSPQSFPKWLKTSFLWHNFSSFLCTDQQCHLLVLYLCASDYNVCFSILCLLQEVSPWCFLVHFGKILWASSSHVLFFFRTFITWKTSAIISKISSQTGNSSKLVPYVLISLSQHNQMQGASCSLSLTSWSCSPPAFHHPATSGTALPENWLAKKKSYF